MDNPAKRLTVYWAKTLSRVPSALVLVSGFGPEVAFARWRTFPIQLGKRAVREHYDHVARVLLVGNCTSEYEGVFRDLMRMPEKKALEVFLCMARRSARWDRRYGRGDDRFGQVQEFLDQLSSGQIAGQKMELFRRLALEAFDELERRSAFFSHGQHQGRHEASQSASQGRVPAGAPLLPVKSAAANGAPGNCRIKGKINRMGERIYHVPGGRWYDRTKIDPSKGERWFCTEAEAEAAAWRRAKG